MHAVWKCKILSPSDTSGLGKTVLPSPRAKLCNKEGLKLLLQIINANYTTFLSQEYATFLYQCLEDNQLKNNIQLLHLFCSKIATLWFCLSFVTMFHCYLLWRWNTSTQINIWAVCSLPLYLGSLESHKTREKIFNF